MRFIDTIPYTVLPFLFDIHCHLLLKIYDKTIRNLKAKSGLNIMIKLSQLANLTLITLTPMFVNLQKPYQLQTESEIRRRRLLPNYTANFSIYVWIE